MPTTFCIVKDDQTHTLTPHFGNRVPLERGRTVVYTEFTSGQGSFATGYGPNLLSGDPTKLPITCAADAVNFKLGSIICDARAKVRASKEASANATFLPGYDIDAAGEKWSLNLEHGFWETPS